MDLTGSVPTFNDLSIDDNLTQLERVVKYSNSSIALQRLVHVKLLAETASSLSYEDTVHYIVPLFGKLRVDSESVVRQVLAEQMEPISRVCLSTGGNLPDSSGYRLLIETILPILSVLLSDLKPEVRQSAGDALRGVAILMRPCDLGQYVLTIILQLAHDDSNEDLRMTAATLLNELAEVFGLDLCKQFIIPDMVSLGEDPVFRVRKVTALNLHNICRVVGEAESRERLLPTFLRLSKDDVYRVRKACTEAIVKVSKAVGSNLSRKLLIDTFYRLVNDSHRAVRNGALQHLGPFISTLAPVDVTTELLSYFLSTLQVDDDKSYYSNYKTDNYHDSNSKTILENHLDSELKLYSAFSFPAVAVTLGSLRWHELRSSYKMLTRDTEWTIRKTLSYSLHEIAKILNSEQVEADLLPEVKFFLLDIEEVRAGIVSRLSLIFEKLSPMCRAMHISLLDQVLTNSSAFNWRLREMLSCQIPQLVNLFEPESIYSVLLPLTFKLLEDPVCSVREATFDAIAPLLAASSITACNARSMRKIAPKASEPQTISRKSDSGSIAVEEKIIKQPRDSLKYEVYSKEVLRCKADMGEESDILDATASESKQDNNEVKNCQVKSDAMEVSVVEIVDEGSDVENESKCEQINDDLCKEMNERRDNDLAALSDDLVEAASVISEDAKIPTKAANGICIFRPVKRNCSERGASVVSMIREYAHAPSYHQRQMYIYICQRLQTQLSREDFITEFIPSLAELATDRVVNVRIALSRTLGTGRCPQWLLDLPLMKRAVSLLSSDSHGDVRHFMSFLPETYMTSLKNIHFDEKVFSWMDTSSCVSDESTRTQWSMTTQRSEIERTDFPALQEIPPDTDGAVENFNASKSIGNHKLQRIEKRSDSVSPKKRSTRSVMKSSLVMDVKESGEMKTEDLIQRELIRLELNSSDHSDSSDEDTQDIIEFAAILGDYQPDDKSTFQAHIPTPRATTKDTGRHFDEFTEDPTLLSESHHLAENE